MARKLTALLTSEKKDWTTPEDPILVRVRKVGKIILDPCSNRASKVAASVELDGSSAEQNGLLADWKKLARGGLTFVNWPYGLGENRDWARKCAKEAKAGTEITALAASRTSEAWFHDIVLASAPQAIAFIYKRLRFSNAKAVAPFGSIVVYWGRRADAFVKAFEDVAFVVRNPKRGSYPFSSVRYSKDERKAMRAAAKPPKASKRTSVTRLATKAVRLKKVVAKPARLVKAKPAPRAVPVARAVSVRPKVVVRRPVVSAVQPTPVLAPRRIVVPIRVAQLTQ